MSRSKRPSDAAGGTPGPTGIEIAVSRTRLVTRVLVVCLLAEITFVLLDYHVNYGGLADIGALRRMTNIAREDGLASWFGTTQTLLVGLTAWAIPLVVRAQRGPRAPRWRQAGLLGVALLFTYMAIDDGAQVHERLGTTFRVLNEASSDASSDALSQESGAAVLELFPSYAWQVLFVPLFGGAGLAVAWFLWRELSDRVGLAMVFAALSCFALAVGLDFIEGLDEDHSWNLYTILSTRYNLDTWTMERFGRPAFNTLDHFSRSLEESLEMFGMTLFWAVFLRHLASPTRELHVRWTR